MRIFVNMSWIVVLSAISWLSVFPHATQAEEFPPELVQFEAYPGNPVFTAGSPDDWDARIRERGWILRDGDGFHLWYTGYKGERSDTKFLGYAHSPDGIHWQRHPQNPIHTDHWVEDMMVVQQAGTYYMFAEGKDDQAHLLTSTDRIHWTRLGQLDVRQTDGTPIAKGPYGTPAALYMDGTWHLFYERRDAGIWYARSNDLKVWTNVQDEPVMVPGPNEHESKLIALNQIVPYKGRYYAYYHGKGNGPDWSTHVAVSDDLIHWTKYEKNPLLKENKSSGILVQDKDHYLLYSMHDTVHLHLPRTR